MQLRYVVNCPATRRTIRRRRGMHHRRTMPAGWGAGHQLPCLLAYGQPPNGTLRPGNICRDVSDPIPLADVEAEIRRIIEERFKHVAEPMITVAPAVNASVNLPVIGVDTERSGPSASTSPTHCRDGSRQPGELHLGVEQRHHQHRRWRRLRRDQSDAQPGHYPRLLVDVADHEEHRAQDRDHVGDQAAGAAARAAPATLLNDADRSFSRHGVFSPRETR